MPVSLAQAAQNAASDIDRIAIDEFRRSSFILNQMVWDQAVNPQGGGGTLTYGYTRVTTAGTAGTRAINTEFTPQEAAHAQVVVNLKVFGGSYQLDRVLNYVGSAAANEFAFQTRQKILATVATYHDYFINGDSAVDPNGFDGLSKALTTSSTEVPATTASDWTALTDTASAIRALGDIDALISAMNGLPAALLMNRDALYKFMTVIRLANAYKDLDMGDGFRLPTYNGIPLVDLGDKANTATHIIPTSTAVGATLGKTDVYAVRCAMDGLHMVALAGQPPLKVYAPDWTLPGAVKTGEVEGVAALALKATKAAAVLRGVKVK